MLDGRVLGASQVEYKPFGKPPLKREVQASSDLTNPEQAVILENLVVNGIKTPFVRPAFDLVLRRIRSLKRCAQA